jgi:magnesium chelatase family protein
VDDLELDPERPHASARARQRAEARAGMANAHLRGTTMRRSAQTTAEAKSLLESAAQKLRLSARAVDRVTRVARTIADLAGDETLGCQALGEALQYRPTELLGDAGRSERRGRTEAHVAFS